VTQRGALAELFDTWMVAPTTSGLVQFLRYGFVGGAAFVCDFGTLYVATSLIGLHYLVSAVVGFIVGLLVNYWLSVRWVFGTRKFTSGFFQFGLFASVGVVGVGLNELVMWSLTERVGWHYLASKLAATVLVYLWNFSIRKVLIF
jgi:putative flippase GtrA